MHVPRILSLAAVLVAFATSALLRAQDDSRVVLANADGATATFSATEAGWQWTAFQSPNLSDTTTVSELGYQLTVGTQTADAPAAVAWTFVSSDGTQAVFEHEFPEVNVRLRRIYSFGNGGLAFRLETWAQSLDGSTVDLAHLSMLSASFSGEAFHDTGPAPQSFPLFSDHYFVGIEHVSGECHSWDSVAFAAQTPHLAVGADWTFVATVVMGWTSPSADLAPNESPVRAAFLHYLDTVRVKPANIELHTNTWWTLPLPFSEADVLKDIDALRKGFYDRTGMFFDSYALDLGWSDPHSVWRIDAQRFPNGFDAINAKLAETGTKLGMWISPGSAYPDGLSNAWLRDQGYEVTPFDGPDGVVACFAKGNKYQQAVKDSIVGYAQQYGLGHVKLDFMAHTCDVVDHGHPVGGADSFYAIDAGLADVLDSLRAVNPGMALEPLCCGSPPSPWWTMHTPYMLGPDGDDVPCGRVASPDWSESLITARDVAYRAHQQQWIMPTQALETFDIVMQCPGNFENMAAMAVGRGRWFISTYLKPDFMQPEDWDFLAALVRWERDNRDYLTNALIIGGDPTKRQAYGYMFHNPGHDVFCVRNPWIEQRTIELPVPASVTATADLRMIYPRHALVARVEPGTTLKVNVPPYETAVYELIPTDPARKVHAPGARPAADVQAGTPAWQPDGDGVSHYVLDATVTPPTITDGEVCVLVQGAAGVSDATCAITVDGAAVAPVKTTSAGQFAAYSGTPPENWTWFRVPVSGGQHTLHIDAAVPLNGASVGVYVRGATTAYSDANATEANPFPVYKPTQRPWSQAVSALKWYAPPKS